MTSAELLSKMNLSLVEIVGTAKALADNGVDISGILGIADDMLVEINELYAKVDVRAALPHFDNGEAKLVLKYREESASARYDEVSYICKVLALPGEMYLFTAKEGTTKHCWILGPDSIVDVDWSSSPTAFSFYADAIDCSIGYIDSNGKFSNYGKRFRS